MLASILLLIQIAAGPPDVVVTRWVSPDNSKPITFRKWRSTLTPQPWQVKTVMPGRGFDGRLDVFVQESLVAPLRPALETLASDLARETCDVAVFSVSGRSAESLKAFLVSEYQTGMTSALLVGDLPVAWFQLIDDWNGNGHRDSADGDVYEEFPCDLYFSDMNGIWADNMVRLDTLDSLVPGTDSIYDSHTGDISPEIALGRLPASAIGNDTTLLTRYFDKDHRYRTGQLNVTDRALVYIDDDWVPEAVQWDSNVGMLYPDRVFISDSETTRILDYRPRIDTAAYQWISLMSHSWPGGHAMKYNHGQSWDWFYATQIPSLDPAACFYNLFACSNARFVEPGFCGGCYVFQTSTGLGAVGSTKTGSMLEFQDFYYSLSVGNGIGQALTDWFFWRFYDGCQSWERSWYYGMCCIDDPTLRPRVHVTGTAEQHAMLPAALSLRLLSSPVRGLLSVEATSDGTAPCRVLLADASGRIAATLFSGRLSGPRRFSVETGSLPAGIYHVILQAGILRASVSTAILR